MRGITRSLLCLGLVFIGYVAGSFQFGRPTLLRAEPQTDSLPNAIRDRLRDTDRALSETMQVLQDDKRYVPAIQGLNSFATSSGGLDAVADLDSGQGVDPETFAGLYAGQALAEVAEHLGRDAAGHLTYKNKIVRIYSPTRLRAMFASRGELVPAAAVPSKRSTAPKKEKDADAPAEKSEKGEKSKDE